MNSNELFSSDVVGNCREYFRQSDQLNPIDIDGKKYYAILIHPDQHYRLKVMLAREKYKHERWVERYNRWRASRGEPPFQEIVAEVGTFEGVNFRCRQ